MMRPSDAHLDTIVALATPAGRSALAVVRLSGPASARILAALAPKLPVPAPPRRPLPTLLYDGGTEAIDQAVVTFLPAASSPTGEDVAEISMHGSPIAVEWLLGAAVAAGARPARPGEFTERSFRSGKVDLVRAEAVRDLIEARTPAAALASARRLAGGLTERVERVRQDLLAASAGLAAAIDFSEDVGESIDAAVLERLAAALCELDRLAATARTGRLLAHGCRAVILGRPNAGKSTLFNALLGRDRAIVTAIPGTTRDAIEAELDLGGVPVTLVDTAGLRPTRDVVEAIGVGRAREEGERADVVLYVFDASAGLSAEDEQALALAADRPRILVANKSDRVAGRAPALPDGAALVCGLSPEAGPSLRALLCRALAGDVATEAASEVLGSLRQADLVGRARAAAADALAALTSGISPEYAATHCDDALDALADLVGETTSEDVLERLFATFCIGK
jgi:tRNA modification GTPase